MSQEDRAEQSRQSENAIQIGTVAEIDHGNATVRVAIGDLVTDWVPWVSHRQGAMKIWSPPIQGEQVALMAPSGDLANAVVIGSIHSDANGMPSNSEHETCITWPDGSFFIHDTQKRTISMHAPCGIHVVGQLIATEDVIAGTVSLVHHVHRLRSKAVTFPGQIAGFPPCGN